MMPLYKNHCQLLNILLVLMLGVLCGIARAQETPDRTTTERTTVTTTTRTVEREAQEGPRVRQAAIFVKNRAEGLDDKVMVLEDLISARITDMGFSTISREDVVNSVAAFSSEGANAGDENLPGAQLDAIMSNQTSALRLAQNMGADYVFVASITTHGKKRKAFSGYGVERQVIEHSLRVSYKLLDNVKGGSLTGGVVKAVDQSPLDDNFAQDDSETVTDDLLDIASEKLAEVLQERVANDRIRETRDEQPDRVTIRVVCTMGDLVLPDIVRGDDGDWQVTEQQYQVNALDSTVELNGAVIGSAPGEFKARPGLSTIRITREGFRDWERTINVADGQRLVVALQMDEEAYGRWLQSTAFLQQLKAGAKLTDAQAELVRGVAQTFRQSGFRVDHQSRVDIEGDAEGMVRVDSPSIWN